MANALELAGVISTPEPRVVHVKNDVDSILTISTTRVGIGSTEPAKELDVVGEAVISGDFTANNFFVDVSETKVGIGSSLPGALLDVYGYQELGRVTTGSTASAGAPMALILKHTTSANMLDGTGVTLSFRIEDNTSGDKTIGEIKAVRDSADNEGALVFEAGTDGSEEFMRIDKDGNVGIGTSDPGSKLAISGGASVGANYVGETAQANSLMVEGSVGIGTTNPAQLLELASSGNPMMRVVTTTLANHAQIGLYNTGIGGTNWRIANNMSGNNAFEITKDVVSKVVVSQGGDVGIGLTNPTHQLELTQDDGYQPTDEHWTHGSDIRLKKNVKAIKNALEKTLKLRGVNFEWKDPKKHGRKGKCLGLIGQEVEKVFPEWVNNDANGFKTISIRGDTALFVEAIRELKTELDELKAKIK